jgi:hypothetical protein
LQGGGGRRFGGGGGGGVLRGGGGRRAGGGDLQGGGGRRAGGGDLQGGGGRWAGGGDLQGGGAFLALGGGLHGTAALLLMPLPVTLPPGPPLVALAEMATVTGGLLPAVTLEVEGMAATGVLAAGELGDTLGSVASGWHIHQLRSLRGRGRQAGGGC